MNQVDIAICSQIIERISTEHNIHYLIINDDNPKINIYENSLDFQENLFEVKLSNQPNLNSL